MLFRARGATNSEGTPTRTFTIDELLSFRNTWKEKPTADFNFFKILAEAREEKKEAGTAKLVASENGYKVKSQSEIDDGEKAIRTVQSVLNKLTEKNFPELLGEVLAVKLIDDTVVAKVVSRIYDKALEETVFAHLYAQLLDEVVRAARGKNVAAAARTEADQPARANDAELSIDAEKIRVSIINKAQDTYEEMSHLTATDDEELDKIRKRKLANIKFVGQLFIRGMLRPRVMTMIFSAIFQQDRPDAPVPSPIDAEVALELLFITGKEVDKSLQNMHLIYSVIRKHIANKSFTTRMSFLYQNLLDLQAVGWIRKEDPLQAVAAQDPQQQPKRKEDERAEALTAAPPPPPIPESIGLSPEQQKCVQLALPPEAFSSDHARKVCSIIRDANTDGNWETAKHDLSVIVAGVQEPQNRMASFCAIATEACCVASDADRTIFATGLSNSMWESSEVCRGVAWALTTAIANRTSEDCPHFYKRFANIIAANLSNHIPILTAVKDIFARTSNYLDALGFTMEATPQWDIDFITVWELYVAALKSGGRDCPTVGECLDSLASVRQTPFMRRIVLDFVGTMISDAGLGVGNESDVRNWCAKNEKNVRVQELREELVENYGHHH